MECCNLIDDDFCGGELVDTGRTQIVDTKLVKGRLVILEGVEVWDCHKCGEETIGFQRLWTLLRLIKSSESDSFVFKDGKWEEGC